ncbi:uncharacterized protein DS421_20g708320 [Arachis hypogaea]|nr:uncharacterized protein DS421_20g708320 [Arachis hypogaea]
MEALSFFGGRKLLNRFLVIQIRYILTHVSQAVAARLFLLYVTLHYRQVRGFVLSLLQRYTSTLTSTPLHRVFVISIACHFASFI